MSITYEQSRAQIKRFARRVLNRLRSAGAYSVQIEDVEGELNIAWCIARDRFDPNAGVPFAAYLSRGMMNHINRWAQDQIDAVGPSIEGVGKNDTALHEIFPDPNADAGAAAERSSVRRWIMRNLTDESRAVLTMLESPPDILLEELAAMKARSEYGRARGYLTAAPAAITFRMIFDLLGYDRVARQGVYDQLKSLSMDVSQ